MDKNKQLTQTSNDTVTLAKFWGTIIHAVILLLMCVVMTYLSLTQGETSAIVYFLLVIACVTAIMNITSLVLTIRGRQGTGYGFTYFSLAILVVGAAALLQGRALFLSVFLLLPSILGIGWLCSYPSRRFYIATTAIALALAWVIEWANPSWRVQYSGAQLGPIAAVIFAVIFITLVAIQVWRQGGSLRNKMIVAFLAVTLIPLAAITILNVNASRRALTNSTNEKLLGAAEQTATQLDEFMRLNIEAIRTEAQMKDVTEYLDIPSYQRPGSEEEKHLQLFLAVLQRQNPIYIDSVAILDTNGITLLDTYSADIGVAKANRVYFQDAMKTGRTVASDVEFSETTGAASLYFAAPVRDNAGHINGVLRKRFNALILQKYLTANNGLVGEGSFPVLLDNHTLVRLAVGSDPTLNFKSVVPLDAATLAELQTKRHMPPGTAEELSTDLPNLKAGLENYATQPFFLAEFEGGDPELEQGAVLTMKTQPWLMVFAQSQDIFLAPVTTQTNNSILIALILAVVVAAVGYFVAQLLAGPIVRLTHTAETVSGGDLTAQVRVESSDEIGTLAGAFNRMTAQLRDLITSLEERVAARTKDLATVAQVSTATATILETDKLLQAVVDLTKERFNLYHSHIYLLDQAGENLVLAAGAGEPGRVMVAEKRSIPMAREQSLVARAARERKGVTVNDVTEAPDFLPNPLLPDTRSELAVPMVVSGNVIGVFDIQSEQVGRFTDSDVNIQTTMAAQVATSIQNVRSFEQSKAQADLESLVNAIGQKIQRTTSVDETLQTAIREIGVALGALRVSANIQSSRSGSIETKSMSEVDHV